jgi:predicted PurR-regulated permease PerM
VISIAALALMLITVWYMLNLVLLTFLITFIFYNLLSAFHRVSRFRLKGRLPDGAILAFLYIFVICALSLASAHFAPKLVLQINEIAAIFRNFDYNHMFESMNPALADMLSNIDLSPYLSSASSMVLNWASRFGGFSIDLLIAMLLSFLLLLEKKKIHLFGAALANSRISFLYRYFMSFGTSFVHSFGNVMKVQVTIAFINCILSMTALTILRFPQVMGLGIMIFVLGLIPVAGVIISLIPLSIVAFYLGGISMVVAVIIMILVIHAIEAYVLNPKLMSEKTSLPVSFVFIILVVAEHYLKVWGLLIGVPLFIFLLALFEVDYKKVFTPEESFMSKLRRAAKLKRGGASDSDSGGASGGENDSDSGGASGNKSGSGGVCDIKSGSGENDSKNGGAAGGENDSKSGGGKK